MLYKVFGHFVSFFFKFIFEDIPRLGYYNIIMGNEYDEIIKENIKMGFVQRLLLETDFTLEKIASLARVSVAFVRKVKNGLGKNK